MKRAAATLFVLSLFFITTPAHALTCLGTMCLPALHDDRDESDDNDHQSHQPTLPVLNISNGFPLVAGAPVKGALPPAVVEGNTCVFTVHRSKPLNVASSSHWKTKDGTAVAADGDYSPSSGSDTVVTFAKGQSVATINVQTSDVQDDGEEGGGDETFSVLLINPHHASIADGKGVCAITERGE